MKNNGISAVEEKGNWNQTRRGDTSFNYKEIEKLLPHNTLNLPWQNAFKPYRSENKRVIRGGHLIPPIGKAG